MLHAVQTFPIRTAAGLKVFDAILQVTTVLALAAAIAALHTRFPCHLYLLMAPILPLTLWVCSGLVIDRQALRSAPR